MELMERLKGVAKILEDSNKELENSFLDETGFLPASPDNLIKAVLKVMTHTDISRVSLDLGCGNGGWVLLMAAAGYPSYGVELNPVLFDHAERNYSQAVRQGFISAETPFRIVLGDMIPTSMTLRYDEYRKLHPEHLENMPIGPVVNDTYSDFPVTIGTADIIYCWAWPTQSRFVFNMLQTEAKKDVIFVLPSYIRYTTSELLKELKEENTLFLVPLFEEGDNYVGKRKQ